MFARLRQYERYLAAQRQEELEALEDEIRRRIAVNPQNPESVRTEDPRTTVELLDAKSKLLREPNRQPAHNGLLPRELFF